jgi:hypothetical protein
VSAPAVESGACFEASLPACAAPPGVAQLAHPLPGEEPVVVG